MLNRVKISRTQFEIQGVKLESGNQWPVLNSKNRKFRYFLINFLFLKQNFHLLFSVLFKNKNFQKIHVKIPKFSEFSNKLESIEDQLHHRKVKRTFKIRIFPYYFPPSNVRNWPRGSIKKAQSSSTRGLHLKV